MCAMIIMEILITSAESHAEIWIGSNNLINGMTTSAASSVIYNSHTTANSGGCTKFIKKQSKMECHCSTQHHHLSHFQYFSFNLSNETFDIFLIKPSIHTVIANRSPANCRPPGRGDFVMVSMNPPFSLGVFTWSYHF